MDYQDLVVRQNRLTRKQLSEMDSQLLRNTRRNENNHRFSEPKGRINLIKINKNKLPVDFFPKRQYPARNIPSVKLNLPQDIQQTSQKYKKAESQRLHYSPEKTSFFGYFEEQQANNTNKSNSGTKLYNRKFETRDEPKRDAFPIESTRKLTTATKNGKNQFLQLFPSTHDEQLSQIIISSFKARNFKLSPRKEYTHKIRQQIPLIDPQKYTLQRKQGQYELKNRNVSNGLKLSNNSMQNKQTQSLNVTFFNAKSSCLPPINRHING